MTRDSMLDEIIARGIARGVFYGWTMSKKQAELVYLSMIEIIGEELAKGNPVKLPGFGNFVARDKKARVGRNPKTMQEFPITARRVVSFRPSNMWKERIRKCYQKKLRRELIDPEDL